MNQDRALVDALHAIAATAIGNPKSVHISEGIDLFAFLLANVPYGTINPGNLQQGLIEVDGPASRPLPNAIPPLYWYFLGKPHEIAKAIHIQYGYTKPAQTGADATYAGSILVGFELGPRHGPEQADERSRLDPTSGSSLAASLSAIINSSRTVSPQIIASPIADFFEFLNDQRPGKAFATPPLTNAALEPGLVEYDGIARDYDSLKPFPYNLATVVADPQKYDQMLYWSFGGRAYRITKAMRLRYRSIVPIKTNGRDEILKETDDIMVFIGYQGPSM